MHAVTIWGAHVKNLLPGGRTCGSEIIRPSSQLLEWKIEWRDEMGRGGDYKERQKEI
jgi:hypothetical protein